MDMTPWAKLMKYAHLHEVNPDKYPAYREPVEYSKFLGNIKDLLKGFFGADGVLSQMFIFFYNNPALMFLISFGLAFGSFNLVRYALKCAKM